MVGFGALQPGPAQGLPVLPVRTLLADRFKLVVHKDVKEQYTAGAIARSAQAAMRFKLGNGALSGQGATMARLAGELSFVGRQVIDRTGLAGAFDVDLEWTPDTPGATPSPDAGASIFTAIQEQLGLKLEPSTAPLEVIVIDSAERPAEN